ncbi:hypothetical protein MKW94_012911 [Papaver nudicaule]|uniref:RING-CH-type domain-containing protein n=1 Tax=Papaver nudicaule TaxID=74823 RepID=A0AA41RY67_PAPNU|nr:hypothetical protein [Papaver nudicaule]
MMEHQEIQNQQVNTSVCSPEPVVKTETVVVVRSEQGQSVDVVDTRDCGVKDNVVEMSKLSAEKLKAKVSEPEKHNCHVIDINNNHTHNNNCGTLEEGDSKDGERVCRICHLSSDRPSDATSELIQLGCDCKDELGISHRHCAEAWFKLKGNR